MRLSRRWPASATIDTTSALQQEHSTGLTGHSDVSDVCQVAVFVTQSLVTATSPHRLHHYGLRPM